jgi:enolase
MFIDFENIYDSTGNSRVQVNLRGQPQAYAPRTVDQGADEGSAEAETARILAKLRAAGWSISL